MDSHQTGKVFQALEAFRIEIPSWGFANTGTRFGKFLQPAAAATTKEKFSDAGQVHRLTGVCPTIALHVLWDFPDGIDSATQITKLAERHGVQAGSIRYKCSSWTLHMASIIIFSSLWGIGFKEWKGSGIRAAQLLTLALLLFGRINIHYWIR
jgi:L-rhamnose isomerase